MISGLERQGSKMSVSLQEVLENAGYDIKNNPEDAMWLLAQKNEFEELCETAEETSDLYHDEYIDYTLSMEEISKRKGGRIK